MKILKTILILLMCFNCSIAQQKPKVKQKIIRLKKKLINNVVKKIVMKMVRESV